MPARVRAAACVTAFAAASGFAALPGAGAKAGALPPPGDQRFGWRIRQLPRADDFGEPSIVTAHGVTVVDTFGPTLWTASVPARSWRLILPQQIAGDRCPSGDADHAVLADGTILALNLCLAGPANLLYRSADRGKTWRPAGPADALPAEAGFGSDRPWLVAHPTDPQRVYLGYHDVSGPGIWIARSDDGGRTWPVRVPVTMFSPVTYGEAGAGNTTARPVFARGGSELYVAYAYTDPVTASGGSVTEPDFRLTRIGVARSTDGGLSWSNVLAYDGAPVGARVAHLFPAMAADPAGNLYVAFSERREPATSTVVYLLRSVDGGRTWSPPLRVSEPVTGSAVMPAVVAPRPGVVGVAYYATRVKDFDSRAGEWAVVFAQTRNALAAVPAFRHSRVGGVAHQQDICQAGTACLVTGGNRNLADLIGIAATPSGMAQIVWTEDAETVGATMYAEQTRQP